MSKPNLAQRLRQTEKCILDLEKALVDFEALNKKADALQDRNYELEQRCHLSSYIDERKLEYRELTGLEYNKRGESER